MSLIVGAYPVQGTGTAQREFFEKLSGISSIRGLELPYGAFGGTLWPPGASKNWSAVVTAIPGTMQRTQANDRFGLASTDTEGRRSAIEFSRGIKDYAAALDESGHRVEAVELHSAPRGYCSPEALALSLQEVLDWDWRGTRILIEHCDAPRPGFTPEKGFLPFEDEVQVVSSFRQQGRQDIGILVNWARSVIETGQRQTAADHITLARGAGVLAGLMFSGCSPEQTDFGYPWIDAHLPPVEIDGAPDSSLLNAHEIRRCILAAGELPITGFKIGLPGSAGSPTEKVARLQQMCRLVTGGQS